MATRALVYESELLDALVGEFSRAKDFHIAVALVTNSGLPLLIEAMTACLTRRGKGEILVGVDLPSHPDALASLIEMQREFPEGLSVKRFKSPTQKWFHPKLYLFGHHAGRRHALVGSSNMTAGGLQNNYEASLWSEEPGAVRRLSDYFDELFHGSHAHPVTTSWLVAYRLIWEERRQQQREAERSREKVRSIPRGPSGQKPPTRIRGKTFVFTGGISGWPRERRLYPRVRKLGGLVGSKASALPKADALVHGDRLGDKGATVKLKAARKLGVPIISEEEFLLMLKNAGVAS